MLPWLVVRQLSQTISFQSQCVSAKAKMARVARTVLRNCDLETGFFPAIAAIPIKKLVTARQASRNPAGLTEKLEANSPREKSAQEVVMPQLGHGIPKMRRMEQGGRPNCWCVPIPLGSGVSNLATANPREGAIKTAFAKV